MNQINERSLTASGVRQLLSRELRARHVSLRPPRCIPGASSPSGLTLVSFVKDSRQPGRFSDNYSCNRAARSGLPLPSAVFEYNDPRFFSISREMSDKSPNLQGSTLASRETRANRRVERIKSSLASRSASRPSMSECSKTPAQFPPQRPN